MGCIAQSLANLQSAFDGLKVPARADFAFHRAVAAASGNELFPESLDTLNETIEIAMTVALGITSAGSKERARRVVEEHESIAGPSSGETRRQPGWRCDTI